MINSLDKLYSPK